MPTDDQGPLAAGADPGGAAEASRKAVYLQPGQLHAAAEPTAITTVLGSCIAVCLFDEKAGVGGMNHFLLPTRVTHERSARFGNVAMEELLAAVTRLGAHRQSLRAKVFGGAAVLSVPATSRRHLGEENSRVAVECLRDMGIPMLDGNVGGTRGRKIVFHTETGEAWMRLL